MNLRKPHTITRRGRHGLSAVPVSLLIGCLLALSPAPSAQAQSSAVQRATKLMHERLYRDAAKVLQETVDAAGDQAGATELRMLGECHYLQGDYAVARPYFSRALSRDQGEQGRIICESRLALVAYRLKDYRGAQERIENFLRKYPNDNRVGTLRVIQIKMINEETKPPVEKLRLIEPIYQEIADNKKLYGYHNAVLASQILGELYVKTGKEEQAIRLFTTAVHEMRGLIGEFRTENRPIPSDLMTGVDSMSLQIADYYMDRKDWNEAVKWLENVAYVGDLVQKSKLILAQIAYQRNDYRRVVEAITDKFLESVPPGDLKSGMYLLLGYSHREKTPPDLESAKRYLKLVDAKASGYAQAQHGLGDIYREEKDDTLSEKYYLVSVKDEKYAAPAHFHLGQILLRRLAAMPDKTPQDKEKRAEILQQAAGHFEILVNKHPLTAMAKEARPLLEQMQRDGAKVTIAFSDEDKLKLWEQTVRDQPDTPAAAQALLSMADYYSRTVYDEKGKNVVKAANWDACAKACHALLKNGDRPYPGVAPDRWRDVSVRALYFLGMAELGSVPLGPSAGIRRGPQPTLKEGGGDAGRAADYLQRAMNLLPAEGQTDFRKDVDIALMEAMFKSDSELLRQKAERQYEEKKAEYGDDPRYRRLEMALADWYAAHQQFEPAAKTYRRVARKSDLEREEIMRLLYLAGVNYNQAGREATASPIGQKAHLGFFIHPKETLVSSPELKAHPVFKLVKRLQWHKDGPAPTGVEVLQRVSRAFGTPFVWLPDDAPGSVANELRTTQVPVAKLVQGRESRSLEEYVGLVLDPVRYKMGFDLGATGGKPTIPPPKADEFESDQVPPTIEIFDTMRARFPSLAKDYGPFALHHPGVTMVFHVVQRVENVTGSRVFWDETVDKEALLAFEFRGLPGDQGTQSRPCDDVLRATVEPLGLSVRVIRRDRGGELIEASNDCFNELRKFGMDTSYAEEAMFNLAVNFFYLKDYEKMKLVLREYLRVYDTPSHRRYYDACFWLGWLFERDRKFREAIKNYTLAAEEKLVLYRRAADEPLPPAEELKKRLSYDTLFSLMLKANGLFKDARLGDQFVSFIRFNTNVDVKLDPAAAAIETLINRDPFAQVPCFDLLYGVMAELGLGLRAENGDAAVAEKSYFRMAATYKKDNLLQEALEHVDTLLRRFPETGRKFDAHKLRLDIFRGLKDYARAIQTLETLRALVPDETEAYKLDYEAGRIYFDLADYEQAEKYFARVLSNANAEGEWLAVREVLAHTYLRRRETHAKAITEYRSLLQYETSPLRSSVHTLMVYYLESVLASPDLPKPVFPPKEDEFMRKYETLTDRQRQQLSQNDVARVTWIYYTRGLLDLQANRLDDALSQLDAASVSPDAFMAGDALVQAGKIHMGRNQFQKAKDVFQHLLFAIDAAEPTVRATYLLGVCHEKLDQKDAAFRRYEEVLTRFPVSPYAELVKRERLYLERTGQWPPPWAVTNGVGVVSNAIGVAGVTGLVTRTAPATNVAQAAGVPTATNTTATPVPVAAPTNGTQREAKRP